MRLLVAGADRVDAGKTTFSVGLLARTGGVGFKPRAGNDHWFDHGDVRRATAEGRLYGKDARRLAAAGAGDCRPEDCNPVHRLWRPAPDPGAGLLGRTDREYLVDRVAGSLVVNARADLPPVVRRNLDVGSAVAVESIAELNAVTERRHLPALRAVGERVRTSRPAVVESYGDVARPLQGSLPGDPEGLYDAVAVVEPGRARVYDGDRYVRACAAAGESARDGRLERRVGDAVAPLDPVATVRLAALPADDRTDPGAVADAYAPAYDALLSAARSD